MLSKDCANITFYGKKMCKVRDFVGFYLFMIVKLYIICSEFLRHHKTCVLNFILEKRAKNIMKCG